MRIALIDIGSNTIKYSAYQVENGAFSPIGYEVDYAYLISCVAEKRLTGEGVNRIAASLLKFKEATAALGCDRVACFSTASLRYIENQREVQQEVYARTGLWIRLLSGDDEAYFNARSMALTAKSPCFCGADLGGGSLQLFSCQVPRVTAQISLPLGALKLYDTYVSGVFPTLQEAKVLRQAVRETLEAKSPLKGGWDTLYFMGGSVRMIAWILTGGKPFAVSALEALAGDWLEHPEHARETIAKTIPERERTILPAMLVVLETAAHLGVSTIVPTTNSVREGYLLELMEQEKEG